jgi:hypothetical protein
LSTTEISDEDLIVTAKKLLMRLAVVSHGTTQSWNKASPGADKPIWPSGGIHSKDDWQEEFPQKSFRYFERKLKAIHTIPKLRLIVAEMEAAVEAWTKTPIANSPEPERKSGMWKRWIAHQEGDAKEIARTNQISLKTVYRYREQYRGS